MMKVERVTADVIVAEQLKKWIIEKNLQPGDRLPTEQVLSEELGVARHTDVEPDGLCGSSFYSQIFIRVKHVSHKRRVPICLIIATTAASFPVFIKLVGHDVSHEVRLGIL